MGKGSAKKTPTSGSKPRSPSGAKGANGKVSVTELWSQLTEFLCFIV